MNVDVRRFFAVALEIMFAAGAVVFAAGLRPSPPPPPTQYHFPPWWNLPSPPPLPVSTEQPPARSAAPETNDRRVMKWFLILNCVPHRDAGFVVGPSLCQGPRYVPMPSEEICLAARDLNERSECLGIGRTID